MSIPRILVLSAWLAGMFGACSRVEVVGAPNPVPIGEGGAAGEGHGGSGSLAGEKAGGESGMDIAPGGAPAFIDVAIWPTYAATPDGGDADAVLAAVTTLSAGSLTLPIHARWDELSGSTGTPRALAWQRLNAVTKPFRDRDGNIALCIDVVDRTLPAWPFAGPLDEAVAVSAMTRTIDEVVNRYADNLSLLCFGYEVDRYLAVSSNADRQRLLVLLTEAVAHAKRRGVRRVGVAVTLDALVTPVAAVDELRLGNEVVAVYDPLDAAGQLKEPDSVAAELASALSTINEHDEKPRQLALFEVGYPSSSDAGASEQAQRDYFTALFAALDSERDDVSFVGVNGLGDRAEQECEAEMAAFGEAVEPSDGALPDAAAQALVSVRALARCSMGLRAENAEPKLAWPGVLGALSRYTP